MKRVLVFQEIYFKILKLLKTLESSSGSHIKTCWSLKGELFWKLPFFRTYAFSAGFKMKPLRELTQTLLWKLLKEANVHLLCIWRITLFKHLEYVTMEYIELNYLCKYLKNVRSSQTSRSINLCAELSETKFLLLTVVNLWNPWKIRMNYFLKQTFNSYYRI